MDGISALIEKIPEGSLAPSICELGSGSSSVGKSAVASISDFQPPEL